MSKAIYFSDLADASGAGGVEPTLGSQNSTCYDTFADLAKLTDMDAPWDESGSTLAPSSRSAARRIRRTRQRLGTYRHDLLVAMRVVNSIEREMMQSEWETWLANENSLCNELGQVLGKDDKLKEQLSYAGQSVEGQKVWESIPDHHIQELRQWQKSHCSSCKADYETVMRNRVVQLDDNMQ